MGRQILGILGLLGSLYGVILYFIGRHIFRAIFGKDMFQVGSAEGTLITVIGVGLALVGTALACAKLATMFQIHKM